MNWPARRWSGCKNSSSWRAWRYGPAPASARPLCRWRDRDRNGPPAKHELPCSTQHMKTPLTKPALPTPGRARWQPLRLGLVELFHYDSEEFWFRDGHLLLRGNNGTGKSKVLSLTLPFLFDAQLKSSRIEPDGDPGKKMAWNLLIGRHDRRMGYAWIEFGRVAEDGAAALPDARLRAVRRHGARRRLTAGSLCWKASASVNDLWLTSPQRVVLTRERLRDALEGTGQVFDTAAAYRRAVDERLFHLGPTRYAALMDTLIQLRQPQLSKKPDEASLSNALTEALPPMSTDLLTDVADALNQLEEYRRELEEYEALERRRPVQPALPGLRLRPGRRQARSLRSAQTEFDSRQPGAQRGAAASCRPRRPRRRVERAARASRDARWPRSAPPGGRCSRRPGDAGRQPPRRRARDAQRARPTLRAARAAPGRGRGSGSASATSQRGSNARASSRRRAARCVRRAGRSGGLLLRRMRRAARPPAGVLAAAALARGLRSAPGLPRARRCRGSAPRSEQLAQLRRRRQRERRARPRPVRTRSGERRAALDEARSSSARARRRRMPTVEPKAQLVAA